MWLITVIAANASRGRIALLALVYVAFAFVNVPGRMSMPLHATTETVVQLASIALCVAILILEKPWRGIGTTPRRLMRERLGD